MTGSTDRFLQTTAALESIAAVEHERWAHWQDYLHSQCDQLEDGSLRIPAHLVTRWKKQAATAYADLTEKERDSDRDQAREYISALRRANALG